MADQAEKLRQMAAGGAQVRTAALHSSRVISITSGKGGTGKSNLTVNLALALSLRGKRTVIFDADFGTANIDILLGLQPEHDLHSVMKGQKELSEIILEGPLGIRVVPGGAGFLDLGDLDVPRRRLLLDQLLQLEKNCDYVLVDTGAGLTKTVVGFLAAAHDVLLVTTPEPTAVADAYRIAKVTATCRLHDSIKLVVNQSAGGREGLEVARRFGMVADKYLGLSVDLLGTIPQDRAVSLAVKRQEPFLLAYPGSPAAVCLRNIASNLDTGSRAEKSGMGGFYSRLSKIFERK